MAQRDVVLRWIEQLARLVARLLGRGTPGDLAEARQQVEEAAAALLGPLALLVPQLDAASAAELVSDPDRIFVYAQLLDLEAAVAEARGEAFGALRERAVAFAAEAITRAPEPRPDWSDWVEARA